jgi:hypothetical protein
MSESPLVDCSCGATQMRFDLERLLALVGKMRDDWADGDATVKKELWANLHTFAGEVEARYEPLERVSDERS